MSLRVLIAVTHLLGAGHLTRAAAIGRAFARSGHRVTLVSGGTPAPLISTAGCDVVQLPPVRAAVDDLTTLRDEAGRPAGPELLAARRARLLSALDASAPDIVITELYPFGRRSLAGEFEALVAAAGRRRPRPILLASVRDILAPPSRPEKAEATRAVVARSYRLVLVHGDERLIPLDASWPIGPDLRNRLAYTGYVGPDPAPPSDLVPGRVSAAGHDAERSARSGILVSGGSSAASLPLYRAAMAAAALDTGWRWRILVGAGVADAEMSALSGGDRSPNALVERARPDFRELMSRAAVFVGQAGYNTVMDLVATRSRPVLVPFEAGRETEQRLRADRLAALAAAVLLPEADLSPAALLRAVAAAEALPRPDFADVRVDGAAETVRIVERLAVGVAATATP